MTPDCNRTLIISATSVVTTVCSRVVAAVFHLTSQTREENRLLAVNDEGDSPYDVNTKKGKQAGSYVHALTPLQALVPPSIVNPVPVTQRLSSLASHATSPAMSLGAA